MATTRRQFSQEFKLEAVRLVKERGTPQAQIARDLGIRPDMLRTWKRQAEGRAGFVAAAAVSGNQPSPDEELQRLRRENERLRQERDFLKKAAAYFATESRCATPASTRTGTSFRSPSCAACWVCPAPASTRHSSGR